jgi:hypothetical protein
LQGQRFDPIADQETGSFVVKAKSWMDKVKEFFGS